MDVFYPYDDDDAGGQDQRLRYAILRFFLVLRPERRALKLSIECLHKSQLFAGIVSTRMEFALVFRVAYELKMQLTNELYESPANSVPHHPTIIRMNVLFRNKDAAVVD